MRSLPTSSVLLVAGALGALLLACGPVAEKPCGPDTCTGCCDGAGVCQTGVTEATCGAGGNTCAACSSPLVCQLGACVQSGTCNGCVDSAGKCVAGTAAGACGSKGAQCTTCTANQACNAGTCVTECKAENGACLSGAECCSGQCSLLGFCTQASGTDGGDDAGTDAGDDAGADAGDDAGVDGGNDGGTDAGMCGDLCQPTPAPQDPNCGDPCVAQVCGMDPFCCANAWDFSCAQTAASVCNLACGGPDAGWDAGGWDAGGWDGGSGFCGPVCVPAPVPMDTSCADPCVAQVCGVDPFCCQNSWDGTCVQEAQTICGASCGFDAGGFDGGFGDGGSGICGPVCAATTLPLDPSCADPCIATVCASDPYCCNTAWDPLCVSAADSMCNAMCPGADGGWGDGGFPDASWPDASWPDAGWFDAGWADAGFPKP